MSTAVTASVRKSVGPHWTALRVVAGLLKLIAWLLAFAGIIGSVGVFALVAGWFRLDQLSFLSGQGLTLGIVYLVAGLLATLLEFVIFYAFSELLLLLVAIENNTRPQRF
ncbi:MAG: hypothetical protein J2P37_11915 [Ktedonobacteraceae bacterium]|nr:hypothetical protein [Ktedonobacteraceae bacterium]MBO0793344.1 hypothetical protein [Ktedonobacteraceae bacterium]